MIRFPVGTARADGKAHVPSGFGAVEGDGDVHVIYFLPAVRAKALIERAERGFIEQVFDLLPQIATIKIATMKLA